MKTDILLKHIPGDAMGQDDIQHVTEVVNLLTLLVGREVLEKEFVGEFAASYSGELKLGTRARRS